MRLAGRQMGCRPWAGSGRETSLAPTFMLRPFPFPSLPLPLVKNQSCQPPSLCLIYMPLLPLSPLPLSCHHAALRAAASLGGRDCRPPPAVSSLPYLLSGGLADGCKHACGEDLTSLPLPLPFSFFRCPGGADVRHIPCLPFFLPFLSIPGGAHWRSLPSC